MSSPTPSLADRLAKAARQLPFLPQALSLVWQAARAWTAAWTGLLAVQALLPVATVYLTRALVDSLAAAVRTGGGWRSVQPAVLPAAGIAAVLLAAELLRAAAAYVRAAQAELVQDHINSLIHEKSIAADLAFYDSADFYDHLHRARSEASYRPVELLESLGSLLGNALTLAAMGAVLLPYGVWLPALLLAGTAPALWVVLRHSLLEHQWNRQVTVERRRTWYFDWLLTAADSASELRLFGLGGLFRGAYESIRRRLREEKLVLAARQLRAELMAGAIAMAATGVALVWMVWRAIQGLVTLGDLALFYQAFHQGMRLMRSLLDNIGRLYANVLFLGNLFEFLGLEPAIADPPRPIQPPAAPSIRFSGVTFRYPGAAHTALQDFDLDIPAGQFAAIVGSNGAGKSTLVKLLCRFYDPAEGRIEFDGADLRAYSVDEMRRRIAVLFQQPVHYNATVRENIAYGGLAAGSIDDAIAAAGAAHIVERLPQGPDTLLGRWFADGVELSVGEWQSIALARAFVRRAPVLVLDEPTSSMDPWSETEWLARLRSSSAGRTILLITHRLSTAMAADLIHVMEQGRIVESGSHQELVARGGRYAAAWNAGPGRAA